MSKKVKGLMKQEIASSLKGVSEFMVMSLYGLDGNSNNKFRADLEKQNISVCVVKNSLAESALRDMGYNNLDGLFNGPCAVVLGGSDIVTLAKSMVNWAKELEKLEIKGAFVEGQVLNAKQAEELSKMLTRAEQQGMVVSMALAPATKLAGAIISPAANIAGCLKTIIDKAEEGAA